MRIQEVSFMRSLLTAMKSCPALFVALGLCLMPTGVYAQSTPEVHAYALRPLEIFAAPPPGECSPDRNITGFVLITRQVLFLGPNVGTSGIDAGDVTILLCNG